MIDLDRETFALLGAAATSTLLGAAKWFVARAVAQFDERIKDHEGRIAHIESEYVTKESLRTAIAEIRDAIDGLDTDLKRGVDTAHTRLDTIYNELLRRAGS